MFGGKFPDVLIRSIGYAHAHVYAFAAKMVRIRIVISNSSFSDYYLLVDSEMIEPWKPLRFRVLKWINKV